MMQAVDAQQGLAEECSEALGGTWSLLVPPAQMIP